MLKNIDYSSQITTFFTKLRSLLQQLSIYRALNFYKRPERGIKSVQNYSAIFTSKILNT